MQFEGDTSSQYYLYRGNTDMRKGFDSLSGIVTSEMQMNALSGYVYIFTNRRQTQIKLLQWSGDGFSVYYKRLERGTFTLPVVPEGQICISISFQQLQMMFDGISMKRRYRCKRYQHTADKC
jgi:transposase